ncbi:MAG TPA: twin-arginine translocase TatA/TatE family subunit [Allosphingosinicella sp.]|nr:twin-arginine translocase TatA/TatE family subunit [Allosphingosinicella sp.]
MGGFSLIHWIVVILVIVLLFGAGRVSGLMGDVAKGIKSFKKGMSEDEEQQQEPRRLAAERTPEVPAPPAPAAAPAPAEPVRPTETDRNQA